MSVRIGILQCIDKFDDSALRYLLLRTNQIQKSFEIEFLPSDPRDPFLRKLAERGPVDRDTLKAECAGFHARQTAFLLGHNTLFDLAEQPPSHLVVLTTAVFEDNYYSMRRPGLSVIALGNWRRHMSPPSILEFILTLVVREVIACQSKGLRGSIHLGTKGCLCDFTQSLDDVRYKVLTGHLCRYCRAILESEGQAGLADDIEAVVSNAWIGTPGEPGSPASIVAGLGHDLFFVKGWRETPMESLKRSLQEEGAKQLLTMVQTVLAAVLVAALIVFFGLKI